MSFLLTFALEQYDCWKWKLVYQIKIYSEQHNGKSISLLSTSMIRYKSKKGFIDRFQSISNCVCVFFCTVFSWISYIWLPNVIWLPSRHFCSKSKTVFCTWSRRVWRLILASDEVFLNFCQFWPIQPTSSNIHCNSYNDRLTQGWQELWPPRAKSLFEEK